MVKADLHVAKGILWWVLNEYQFDIFCMCAEGIDGRVINGYKL